jgi:hypothetical protein
MRAALNLSESDDRRSADNCPQDVFLTLTSHFTTNSVGSARSSAHKTSEPRSRLNYSIPERTSDNCKLCPLCR